MPRMPRSSPPRRPESKLLARSGLARTGARLRRARRRVVFTNGCFDLLHPGHVHLLQAARAKGDLLVVGLNSDRSVRALKGPGRPILAQRERAAMLAALECVDYVTIFSEPTPLETIRLLQPDVLVKGSDWGAREIVGRDVVEARGGRVVRVPPRSKHSTSRIVERIRRGDTPRGPRRRARARTK